MNHITGYIDHISQHTLIGWIANIDHPNRLEFITCVGANGSSLKLKPFVPREDVCNALGMTGRFGFAFPAFLVGDFGPTISFIDENGAYLQNGRAVPLPVAVPSVANGPAWIVLHIQKTAGTSLRSALTAHVKPGEAVFIYPDGFIGLSEDEFAALPWQQRAALRVVMGHTSFGIADHVPGPAEYITFLREPLARLRSHYFHHLAMNSVIKVEGVVKDTATIVAHGLTTEFDNLMVRVIAGVGHESVPCGTLDETHVEQAMFHIRTYFRFVGIVERLDTHYPALAKATALELPDLAFENTCRLDSTGSAAASIDWSRVMQLNRFDTMLYNRVQDEGLCGHNLNETRSRR